jgi:hypothetical protein
MRYLPEQQNGSFSVSRSPFPISRLCFDSSQCVIDEREESWTTNFPGQLEGTQAVGLGFGMFLSGTHQLTEEHMAVRLLTGVVETFGGQSGFTEVAKGLIHSARSKGDLSLQQAGSHAPIGL